MDPYLDPTTGTLRNRLGITDPDRLAAAEARFAFHAEIRLYVQPPRFDRYNLSAYRAVHRHLFDAVYEWAGDFRTIDLTKATTRFAHARHLHTAATNIFRQLADDNELRHRDADDFASGASRLLADLNALHPFREGNGRTQRAFLQLLANAAGWRLAWAQVQPADNDKLSRQAMVDPDAFTPLLRHILQPSGSGLPPWAPTNLILRRPDPPAVDR